MLFPSSILTPSLRNTCFTCFVRMAFTAKIVFHVFLWPLGGHFKPFWPEFWNSLMLYFCYWRISDLQAHIAPPSGAIWACIGLIFLRNRENVAQTTTTTVMSQWTIYWFWGSLAWNILSFFQTFYKQILQKKVFKFLTVCWKKSVSKYFISRTWK